MIKIQEAIVVEGRYDKNTLSQIVDTAIFQTNGFGIFKDVKQMVLLRQIAAARGLIVLTDSDGAGLVIRNYLKSSIPSQHLKHAYIPDIPGKERRKDTPGKEGLLGVEGMRPEVILEVLRKAGATVIGEDAPVCHHITKQDMVALGLSGGADSSRKRLALQKKLHLPEKMSANALLQALDLLYTFEELQELVLALDL